MHVVASPRNLALVPRVTWEYLNTVRDGSITLKTTRKNVLDYLVIFRSGKELKRIVGVRQGSITRRERRKGDGGAISRD